MLVLVIVSIRCLSSSIALSLIPDIVLDKRSKNFGVYVRSRFLILERGGVQKTRSVDYAQNVNCFSPEAKHASVAAIKQMPVPCPQNVILGYEGTSFREAF